MIVLITGGPGTGKTAFTLSQLLEEKYQGRPLYVDGVKDLQIDHEEFDPHKWPDELPEGSLAVIDECQRYWRPAGSGKALPDSIAELETHRHKGIDFFIVTQHPSLLHNNVRRLVGRHIHIVANWAGRKQYEWAECKTDPQQGRANAVTKKYTLPKKVYKLYKSAEVHTKQNRRLPVQVYILGALLVLGAILFARVFGSINDKISGTSAAQSDKTVTATSSTSNAAKGTGVLLPQHFVPRVPHQPETAPAYDEVRKVTTFPKASACVMSERNGCKCYTQQGSRYLTTDNYCKTFIAQSSFDPYRLQPNNNRRDNKGGTGRDGRARVAGAATRAEAPLSSSRDMREKRELVDPYRQTATNYQRTIPK